jgi:hypothetical protein
VPSRDQVATGDEAIAKERQQMMKANAMPVC